MSLQQESGYGNADHALDGDARCHGPDFWLDPLSFTDENKARRILRIVSINLHKNVTAYIQTDFQYLCGPDHEDDWPVVGIREWYA